MVEQLQVRPCNTPSVAQRLKITQEVGSVAEIAMGEGMDLLLPIINATITPWNGQLETLT
jgi:hypothetical protein